MSSIIGREWATCKACRSIWAQNLHLQRRASSSTAKDNLLEGWETVIGLEIHAQIRTGRKLFSKAPLSYNEPPNLHVHPHDAALPGSMPVLDKRAIRLGVMTALALNCTVNDRSTFDRKHYFYHDIPASYQITQHYNPLARDGHLDLIPLPTASSSSSSVLSEPSPSYPTRPTRRVRIKQLQIEQDTAKSQTISDDTLIDLNRAGTGLMEIVTEPDMRTVEEAGIFVRRLQALLRRVGSGDGDMEKGNLRIDANVSVNRPGSPFGTRCEIKNLNSVRFLQAAISYEAARHIRHYIDYPDQPLLQETRGVNEVTGETFSLRTKEEATDYRYMPDSNLPSIIIAPKVIEKMRELVPELPWNTVRRLMDVYGLREKDAETIVALDEYGGSGIAYYETVVEGLEGEAKKKAGNWIVHELLGQLKRDGKVWESEIMPAGTLRALIRLIDAGSINGTEGKNVMKHFVQRNATEQAPALRDIMAKLGISERASSTSSDSEAELDTWCRHAVTALPNEAARVKAGNDKVVMRLVGQVMKVSSGRADARKAKDLIISIIRST